MFNNVLIRRGGRVAEGAPLLREYTLKAYRGFESLSLRHYNMSNKTLFEKIIEREIPSEIIHEDDKTIVIKDINPQAPIHWLVIPKTPIPKISDCSNDEVFSDLFNTVNKVCKDNKIESFRIVINNGAEAGQEVFHIHIHILSGRKLNWPPG